MDQDTDVRGLLAEAITKSQQPAILLPPSASLDAVAAATVLRVLLGTMTKSATVICPTPIAYPQIPGSDHITSQIGSAGDNLIISFPYVDGSIDKVDYRIENGAFNLIVIPRAGFAKITPDQISYRDAGGQPDCIITLDIPSLPLLGDLYSTNQALFDAVPVIVNIDRHADNQNYGNVNYVEKGASSLSELMLPIIESLQLTLDAATSTSLYTGILSATQNLTSPLTSAETFEAVAALIRAGASRQPASPPPSKPNQSPPRPRSPSPSPGQSASTPVSPNGQAPQRNPHPPAKPSHFQYKNPKPAQPHPLSRPRPETARGDAPIQKPKTWMDTLPSTQVKDIPHNAEGTTEKTSGFQDGANQALESPGAPSQTPADWLKPKMNRGNGFV